MSGITINIVVICVLISLSALFSCSETAFFSLTRSQLERLKSSKRSYAKLVIKMLSKPRETLITILMGNELVNVAFTIAVAALTYKVLGDVSWKISTLVSILTAVPLILIFGEVLPKNLAIRFAAQLTPLLIIPIRFFSYIVAPVRFLLTRFVNLVVRLFGGDPTKLRSFIMEEEFRQMVDLGYKEGALEEGELELIHRLFELGNRYVAAIMTPVGEMFRLPIEHPIEKIVQEMRATQFNRVPVYQGSPDNIIGILHLRDVFRVYRGLQRSVKQHIEEIVRPVHFVNENDIIENVLTDFQKLRIHMGIVLNDENQVVGVITMDDIFRVLFTQKLDRKTKRIVEQTEEV